MVVKALLESQVQLAIYKKKPDTRGSYRRESGETMLPERVDIMFGDFFSKIKRKGRIISRKTGGQIKGQFTKVENSPLKLHKPYKIHSAIFKNDNYPQLSGYCDLSVSDEHGETKEKAGYLAIAKLSDNLLLLGFIATTDLMPDAIDIFCSIVSERQKIERSR